MSRCTPDPSASVLLHRLAQPIVAVRAPLGVNSTIDPTGYGEGETFLAAHTVTAGSNSHTFVAPTDAIISMTLTEELGGPSYRSTSEFSQARFAVDISGTVF